MDRRAFNQLVGAAWPAVVLSPLAKKNYMESKIGIIGLDTSHATAFSKIINQLADQGKTPFRVTMAYPWGSKNIKSSMERIPGYTEEIKKYQVKVTESMSTLLQEVDYVLLETNDGSAHLEQAIQVIEAKKPFFLDKPVAANMQDVMKIYQAAAKHNVPLFSASALRFAPSTQDVAKGKIGRVLGADTFTPALKEPSHSDLYWYGIHGVESLLTVMGSGCKQVQRFYREDMEVNVGEWADGRLGTFRGLRASKHDYGGYAYGTDGIATVGKYEGYEPLVQEILRFFESRIPPVTPAQTLEIYAFMTAAAESSRLGGKPVEIAQYIK